MFEEKYRLYRHYPRHKGIMPHTFSLSTTYFPHPLSYSVLISFPIILLGLPRCLSGKESTCQIGDTGSIPGSGRSPGEVNSNPLQYSCLRNPMDRGSRQATVHRVTRESDMTQQLNNYLTNTFTPLLGQFTSRRNSSYSNS